MEVLNNTSDEQKININLKALTWIRNSHGLFDYETFEVMKTTLKICSDCTLVRSGIEVRALTNTQIDIVEKLARVCFKNGKMCDKYR